MSNDGDCLRMNREECVKRPRVMRNMTYSVVSKACNKVMIGKTYWKSVVIPSALYCSGAIGWNEIDLERMQRCENARSPLICTCC